MTRLSPSILLIAIAVAAVCVGFCRGGELGRDKEPLEGRHGFEPLPSRMGGFVGTPHRPGVAARPDGWPTVQAQYAEPQSGGAPLFAPPGSPTEPFSNPAPSTALPTQPPAEIPNLTPFEPGQTIARVGSEIILASEIPGIAKLAEIAEEYKNNPRIPAAQREAAYQQLAAQWERVREALDSMVETKLLVSDFRRTAPAEGYAKYRESLSKKFDEDEIPEMLKKRKLSTRAELEAQLRQGGTSLEDVRRSYIEQTLAGGWIYENIKDRKEVTHQQTVTYYQQHAEDFEIRGKARWQQLTARKSQFGSDAEAVAAVAAMGNEVLRGRPFAEVAKASSQGPTANSGGAYDWTTQGSLVSTVLDDALFGLPVGSLSQILEDQTGFHIVQVIEREDTRKIPFAEAQSEIREKIKKREEQRMIAEFKGKVRDRTPVWTIFDSPDDLQRISKLPAESFQR